MDMKSIRSTPSPFAGVMLMSRSTCVIEVGLKQLIYSLSIHRQNHKVHSIPEDATRLMRLVLVRMLATAQTIVLRYTVGR